MDDFWKRVRYAFSDEYKKYIEQQIFLEKEANKPNSQLRLKDRGPGLEHVILKLKDKDISGFRIPLFKSDDENETNKGREPGE